MANWICVKDSLPEKLEKVLFFWILKNGKTKNVENIAMGFLSDEGWNICLPCVSCCLMDEYCSVSHWMELPEYPKQDEKLEMDKRTKEFAKRFVDENADLLKRLAYK